ncbi:MAG: ABC transporter ATP-binding protein [Eggerthellaceae bacterium]|nr:ABC transporter ATP-binding protein [Eggerthellaceae bacterium]
MRVAKILLRHKLAVLVCVILLALQAATDLAIPTLTSQIVDVGIQQSGIEHVAADELSAETFDKLEKQLESEGASSLRESYDQTPSGTYVLNETGRARIEDLDALLAVPLAGVHGMQIDQLADEDFARQQGIAAARAEYELLGYDVPAMQMSYLLKTGALMLGVAALGALIAVGISFVASRTGAAIGRNLRERFFARVVAFSDAEIGRFSAASLITRATNDIQLIQMVAIMLLRMVIYAPILAIGGIIMLMVTNVDLGWIIAIAVVAVLTVIAIVFGLALPKFKIMQKLIDRVNLVSREMLTGMPVVRAFGREEVEQRRFDAASGDLFATQLFTNRVMTFMMPAMTLIMNGASVAIVWVGAHFVDLGTIQTGDVIALITYAMVIIMGFLMLGMISIMLPRAEVAAERIEEVLATEPSVKDPSVKAAGVGASPSEGVARGARIAFENVSFRYDDTGECVLSNVSFTAEPGKTLALVGSTGSGKSTVLKLIERFWDVCEGRITIDGVDVRDIPQTQLRAQLGYVPQKAFLFAGSIAENVAYGSGKQGDAADEAVQRALDIAQATDFVGEKEGGASFKVSQGGTNVSGGQRQRLAIARALARDARAYLFDDSFSALDYKTDALLRERLMTDLGDATRIIVAQRIATVMGADCIVVFDEGRVVGSGTHAELMESCEEYREIAYSQLSPEELAGGDSA